MKGAGVVGKILKLCRFDGVAHCRRMRTFHYHGQVDPGGRWHVSVDNPNIQHLPTCKKSVGLDVGLSSLLVTDDGVKTNQTLFSAQN